jgi:Ca2+-binding RTX toxin-like protein
VIDFGPSAVRNDDYYAYDSLDFAGATAGVSVDLTAGTVTGEGDDRIVLPLPNPATGYALEVVGSAHADTMVGSPGPDLLVSEGGDDTLHGLAGDDFLLETWEEGSDSSADHFDGGPGDDSLSTGDGPDTLLGGPGRDTLDDKGGVTRMDGGRARDHLFGYLSSDTVAITGGAGRDELSFNVEYRGGALRPVGGTLDLAAGRLTVRLKDAPSWTASVTDVTSLRLPGYGRWRFVGSDADEVLRAGGARVRADGGGGADRLFGSPKDDVLIGGPGRDRVDGRAGVDRCRAELKGHCER